MNDFICPICSATDKCRKILEGENSYIAFHCETYGVDFSIGDDIINMHDGDEEKERILNLVAEQLLHNPYCVIKGSKFKWHFFFAPEYKNSEKDDPYYLNLVERMSNYPKNVMDVAHRALYNLSFLYPNYGDLIVADYSERRALFEHTTNNAGTSGVLEMLKDLGYLKETSSKYCYTISADGWKEIDELKNQEIILKQAFIAMQFGEQTASIREALRKAIQESGYSTRLIDEKEHNNQIVPEILYEIERSKFVVVDITYPNFGAYYEAGYAQALKKEVIICCRKEEFQSSGKPHFDIAQKSMIIWTNEEDLVERLKRRIEATVIR